MGPLDPLQNYNARANGRILPVKNIVDTLTWTKGKHTITTGINFRVMTNNKFTYSQSYPSYGFNDNVAVGLGEDIQTDLTNYMVAKTGNANFALNDPYNDASALGILLGLVNNTQVTYQVGKGRHVAAARSARCARVLDARVRGIRERSMACDARIDSHAWACATPTTRRLMRRTACRWPPTSG